MAPRPIMPKKPVHPFKPQFPGQPAQTAIVLFGDPPFRSPRAVMRLVENRVVHCQRSFRSPHILHWVIREVFHLSYSCLWLQGPVYIVAVQSEPHQSSAKTFVAEPSAIGDNLVHVRLDVLQRMLRELRRHIPAKKSLGGRSLGTGGEDRSPMDSGQEPKTCWSCLKILTSISSYSPFGGHLRLACH